MTNSKPETFTVVTTDGQSHEGQSLVDVARFNPELIKEIRDQLGNILTPKRLTELLQENQPALAAAIETWR
ncbi:MAG: hypothetical protein V1936_04155 [Patescibacteria group bacterium]